MADMVPWDETAKVFFPKLSKDSGWEIVDLRIVLAVLIIKHIKNLSGGRVIEYVQENICA